MDQLTREARHRLGDSRTLARGVGLRCRYGCGQVFRRPDDGASLDALLAAAADRDAHERAEHGAAYSPSSPPDPARRRRFGRRTGGIE